eukprot:4348580-Pyramimonas_sp.AAC.1
MDEPCGWDEHDVHLIETMTNPLHMKKWRPIAVLSVLWKAYMQILSELGGIADRPLSPNQFAFRPAHQTAE